jgi:hypothetical protein
MRIWDNRNEVHLGSTAQECLVSMLVVCIARFTRPGMEGSGIAGAGVVDRAAESNRCQFNSPSER